MVFDCFIRACPERTIAVLMGFFLLLLVVSVVRYHKIDFGVVLGFDIIVDQKQVHLLACFAYVLFVFFAFRAFGEVFLRFEYPNAHVYIFVLELCVVVRYDFAFKCLFVGRNHFAP